MVFQPKHIKCIQIPQNGTTGLAEPYISFFVTNVKNLKNTQNRFGGGTFELTVNYNDRNVALFSKIETVPTFVMHSFSLSNPWDSESPLTTPHPMPMVVETYNATHNLETGEHLIVVSGRGILDVLLSNKVVMPKLVYQSPPNTTEADIGFYPWDILVDIFGRNVNGEKTPKESIASTPSATPDQYLSPNGANTDPRFISNVSLLHDIISVPGVDPRIERTFECDNLLDVFTSTVTANNLYISGQMKADATGHLHFDYILHRITDLTLGTRTPLLYDYGAMPPKTYNTLLSTQENRGVVYVKVPNGDLKTVTKGGPTLNNTYKGWFCKELYLDSSSLPFGETSDEKYNKMLEYAAADELYREGNMLIRVDDAEYLFTPMEYYVNCWPGCKYSSIGPEGDESILIITALVLTGSHQDGWIITPELEHYTEPYSQN